MLKPVLLTMAVLFLSGCTSMYVYPDLDDVRRGEPAASALSGLVLGVERTPGNVNDGFRARDVEAPYDLQSLVDALNEYQVFRRTAYLDELDVQPDLILRNYRAAQPRFRGQHGEHGGLLCVGYFAPIAFATLTVIPIYCSSEDEVSFTLSAPGSSAQDDFQFTRHSKELGGIWAPVAAKMNASWQSVSPGGDGEGSARTELARRYKKFVVRQFRELEPEIVRLGP
jgi:hypothetical protein